MRIARMLITGFALAGLAACVQEGREGATAESCEEIMADSPEMMRGMMGMMMADSSMRGQMMEMMMEDAEMRDVMMRRMMQDSGTRGQMMEMMGGMPGMEGMGGMPRDTAR